MVEKEEESYAEVPSNVVMDAAGESSPTTVGAAIDILEAKLVKKGILLQFPPVANKWEKGRVDGKLLRLPTLIHLAITHGIEMTVGASEESVGKPVSDSVEKTLVKGNVVALYEDSLHFLRVLHEQVDSFGPQDVDKLPLCWDSERFLVVDAGNGKVAFYSPSHRLFLGCTRGHLALGGYAIFRNDESPRANECFEIIHQDHDSGKFSLRCVVDDEAARLPEDVYGDGSALFRAVQIYGVD